MEIVAVFVANLLCARVLQFFFLMFVLVDQLSVWLSGRKENARLLLHFSIPVFSFVLLANFAKAILFEAKFNLLFIYSCFRFHL